MRFDDPFPPPMPFISPSRSVTVDPARLRAALRLIVAADDADSIARQLPPGGDVDDLPAVARAALDRVRLMRMLGWLPWRRRFADGLLMGAGSGISTESAVALMFAVGMQIDCRRLADVMDARVEMVGGWLVAGRRALDPEMPDPCQRTAALVGRAEDRSLDPDERIELFTHLRQCPTCQRVVERSRAVDAEIAVAVEHLRLSLGTSPVMRRSRSGWFRKHGLPYVMAFVMLVALVVIWTAIGQLFGGTHEPVPLVAGSAQSPYSGWLLIARGNGSVDARHVATGETRQILGRTRSLDRVRPQLMLSPGGTRILAFDVEIPGKSKSQVVVYQLDGHEVGRHEWSIEDIVYVPAGWVNEREIVVVGLPSSQSGQSDAEYQEQYASQTHLLIVDVESGASRELLRGGIAYGFPSPDGRFLAVARMTDVGSALTSGGGMALEIWSLTQDGVDGPIMEYDDWRPHGGLPTWAPDGSRLYSTEVRPNGADSPTVTDQRTVPNAGQHALVAIDLDGTVIELATAGGDSAIYPVSVAPDGSSVIYQRTEGANVLPAVSYWRVTAVGGEPERLSRSVVESYGRYGVAWSPDGSTVVVSEVVSPYLDIESHEWSRWSAAATDLVAVSSNGDRTSLMTSFTVGDRLLAWVPEHAVPKATDRGGVVRFTTPDPVPGLPHATRIGLNSLASLDGEFVTLDDLAVGSPLIWNLADDDTQRLRGSLEDVAWLPGTTGLITASSERAGVETAGHLSILATTNPYAPFSFEPRQFDPVGLSVGDHRRYAAPQVSPNGLNTAFFVVGSNGWVELWLANRGKGATRVAGWNTPTDRTIDSPLVAAWVDNSTLVFVEPGDWRRGLPEVATIRRLSVAADGSGSLEDVLTLSGRGGDRGVAITELAISRDGSDIAWRLRHYTDLDADSGRFDTITLAPIGDLTRDVEVTRGFPGDGLAWSADRHLLLVGIGGKVAVVDAQTIAVHIVSNSDYALHPLWVGTDEIWYSSEGNGTAIAKRVRVLSD